VRAFQERRGLTVDGICGRQTWASLVEAGYRLGDRLLYMRTPYLRGDDVADLQRRLGALGFAAGRLDGIFGPDTDRALRSFQRNAGLLVDGMCGTRTVLSLNRLRSKGPELDAAAVRESVRWSAGRPNLSGTRVTLGEYGGMGGFLRELQLALNHEGAIVTLLSHPDASILAGQANATGADVFVGIALADNGRGCRAAYWGAHGTVSPAGRRLAGLILDELSISGAGTDGPPTPMNTAILRETRMTAVSIELGPARFAVERASTAAGAVARGVARWVDRPCLDLE
jgi:N-acetylmuramoyl-L-alanine amidase